MVYQPPRPSANYLLFAHSLGKKIPGKIYYFGRWDDPAGALAEYQLVSTTS